VWNEDDKERSNEKNTWTGNMKEKGTGNHCLMRAL
jgi:hypothetical protein